VSDNQGNDKDGPRVVPMRGGSPSPTSQRRALAAAKQLQALQLRAGGAGFADIASRLGYHDAGGAHKAYMAALERWGTDDVDTHRRTELVRLGQLDLALAKGITAGDPRAIRAAVLISTRRAKLLGLDAPVLLEVDISVSESEVDADIRRDLAEMTAFEARQREADASTEGPLGIPAAPAEGGVQPGS
jgi:hypothetical protein